METARGVRAACAALCCAAICVLLATASTPAFAVDEGELSTLQAQVEQTSQAYNDATAKVQDLNAQMKDNQKTIDEVGSKLDDQKEKSAAAIKTLYLIQQQGYSLSDIVLGSETLSEFLQRLEYMDAITEQSSDQITKYADMKSTYEQAQSNLSTAQQEAVRKQQEASDALEAAKAARKEAQDRAAREAAEQAKALADAGVIDNSVDWSVDRDVFIKEWTRRIDAYLAGSPMAGTGKAFAEAAWDYGVDPRWSPAIANTESTKGSAIPGGFNAWGWTSGTGGFRSFSSWADGARQHVAYLARSYGYTITVAYAQKYCPPNYAAWYTRTLAEMRSI